MAYRRRLSLTLGEWRERYKKTLAAKFLLRFHMAAVLLLVMATGVVVNRGLLALGARSLPLRYAVAIVAAYAAFFPLMRLWLAYLTGRENAAPSPVVPEMDLRAAAAAEGVAAAVNSAGARRADGRSGTSFDFDAPDPGDLVDAVDASADFVGGVLPDAHGAADGGGGGGGGASLGDLDEGAVVVVVILLALAALAALGTAAYFVWEAPVIFGEAAFELLLASALARASRSVDTPGWSGSLFRATWKGAALVLVVAVVAGAVAQGYCPDAVNLRGVVGQCLRAPRR